MDNNIEKKEKIDYFYIYSHKVWVLLIIIIILIIIILYICFVPVYMKKYTNKYTKIEFKNNIVTTSESNFTNINKSTKNNDIDIVYKFLIDNKIITIIITIIIVFILHLLILISIIVNNSIKYTALIIIFLIILLIYIGIILPFFLLIIIPGIIFGILLNILIIRNMLNKTNKLYDNYTSLKFKVNQEAIIVKNKINQESRTLLNSGIDSSFSLYDLIFLDLIDIGIDINTKELPDILQLLQNKGYNITDTNKEELINIIKKIKNKIQLLQENEINRIRNDYLKAHDIIDNPNFKKYRSELYNIENNYDYFIYPQYNKKIYKTDNKTFTEILLTYFPTIHVKQLKITILLIFFTILIIICYFIFIMLEKYNSSKLSNKSTTLSNSNSTKLSNNFNKLSNSNKLK